jgi:hypothetical protein
MGGEYGCAIRDEGRLTRGEDRRTDGSGVVGTPGWWVLGLAMVCLLLDDKKG